MFLIKVNFLDYAIACAALSIIGSFSAVIFLWIAGMIMCVEGKFAKLRIMEFLIGGTFLVGNYNMMR